ncbi:TonB-dependent receptor [Stenotrophomonas tumulicola]|uniref:TonB-dependent receptor n=1 Tax=Stenotrophomonas tumulicola TaxID=1685415 RepID=A0A7W3FIY9_9GAMM|nr:TonB-dependent receptor [Stenotrophomonas tumulicola]MBA8680398.1 TonB-dependent receptor [Stenotrophomonas tumulicola]
MISSKQAARLKRTALAVVLTSFVGAAAAQSTTGSLYGNAPAAAGTTVVVQSDTGLTRSASVDANGRYNLGSLPVGRYSISLQRDGQVVERRENVQLRVGVGTEVSFGGGGDATTLGAVNVTAANIPKIDVSNTVSRSVITSEQLDVLPLGRSAEAIALLAPGVVAGSSAFTNGSRSVLSFGGSSVTENAYYLNGFNASNPLSNLGGVSLPYGSIDQQETYTGGYSASYGRSTGGVINQLGKRGTNEWHFGFQSTWSPDTLAASAATVMHPDRALPAGYEYDDPSRPGTLYRYRHNDTATRTTVSGYASGPLIEDRLFIHLAAETDKTDGVSTNSVAAAQQARDNYSIDTPKFYGKIDWNINDSNTLEYTRVQNTDRQSGYYTAFDYDTLSEGERTGTYPNTTKVKDDYDIFKFTSYLTDDLTLSAVWGRSKQSNLESNPLESGNPYISGANSQDPSITGGSPIRNDQPAQYTKADDAGSKTRGLRVDLQYRIGDHEITGGIDNMYYQAHNEGQAMTGPGYAWYYQRVAPGESPSPGFGITPPGGDGYFAYKYIFSTTTSMSVEQKAYYLEDRWQVTPNWLVTLGIRNDKFTNFNSSAVPYVESGDQWAPRLGVSWDVFGDSSLKIFANLGRYYLALPNSVAIRGASASTYTREYFTYGGIDANGNPTDLTALGPGPVSSNGEYGATPDPLSVAPTDLKSQYQDELILGFEKTLGSAWNSGAKLTYRRLQSAIDDTCDADRIYDKLDAMGVDSSGMEVPGCVIFNPGKTNTIMVKHSDGSGYTPVRMSANDWGYGSNKAKRDYVAVDLFIEHPMSDKWYGRVDYTWSRSFGNTEGQVKSDIGQDDVSKTQDWDAATIMEYAGGYLANDRRHQLKGYGAYQFNDEWIASATLSIMSGMPKSCLGYYGTDESDPLNGYGSSYHYCNGSFSRPGDAGRQPWTTRVDLGVMYRPAFADHKLSFGLDVFNVLNQRRQIQSEAQYEEGPYTVSNTYNMGTYFSTPRSVRLSASYDF